METKKGRVNVDKYGQAVLNSLQLRDLLLQGKNISHLLVDLSDDEIILFKEHQSSLLKSTIVFPELPKEDLSFDDYHNECADTWIFPRIYQEINVLTWLLEKCKTDIEIARVKEEYKMYEERDLIMLLRLFIYLVSYMRERNFIWGVGRGSSVSSYILYLIGIHKVNSLHYNLDIKDYLK